MYAIDPEFARKITQDVADEFGLETGSFPDWCQTSRDRLLWSMGKRVVEQAKECFTARSQKDERIRELLDAVYMTPPDRVSPLGDDGANIRTTITFEQRMTLHAFFMAVLGGEKPYVRVTPVYSEDAGSESFAAQAAFKKQQFYDTFLDKIGWRDFLDDAIMDGLDYGTSFPTVNWRKRVGSVQKLKRVGADTAGDMGLVPTVNRDMSSTGMYKGASGALYEDGEVREYSEIDIITDAPCLEVSPYFDSFIYPHASKSADSAWMTGRRCVVTRGDLRSGVFSGTYDKRLTKFALDTLKPISLSSPSIVRSNAGRDDEPTGDYVQETVHRMGKASDEVELIEATLRFDADGDGDYEDWCVVVETSTCIPLAVYRSQHLPTVKPLQPLTVFRVTNSAYGVPLPLILDGLQQEADISTALLLDGAALQLTRIILEQKSSRNSLTPTEVRVGVNHLLVDDTDGSFKVETLAGDTQLAIPSIEMMQSQAQRATAAGESMMGATSNGANTATESKQALTGGAKRLTVLAGRIASTLQRTLVALDSLCERYFFIQSGGDPSKLLRSPVVDGRDFDTSMTIEEWSVPCTLSLSGDPATVDPVLRLQAAEKVLLFSEKSPFVQKDMTRRYAVEREFLTRYGVANTTEIIGSAQDALNMQKEMNASYQDQQPVIPPNVNVQWAAMWCVENPGKAAQYLNYYALLNTGKGSQKAEGEPTTATEQFGQAAAESEQQEAQSQAPENLTSDIPDGGMQQ